MVILFHIGLGFAANFYRPVVKFYVPIVFIYFLYTIVKSKNKTKEVLFAAAYFAGAEVFFRMTKALVFYETGKYVVMFFPIIGMMYQAFKKNAYPYVVYIFLLIPGVFVAMNTLGYEENFRTTMMFNLSGPLSLAISAIYCFERKIKFQDLLEVLNAIIYPLIAMTVYIFLYTPGQSIDEIATSAASNPALSGGYGPNQVSTALGLGVFLLYTRFLIPYKNKWVHFVMMFFLVAMAYRALLTFSRGGVFVAIIMAAAFTFIVYMVAGLKTKSKVTLKLLGTLGITFGIWFFTLVQTGGMLGNRYENKDSIGREKEDITTGRLDLFLTEYEAFMDSPILGVGVGKVKSYHLELLGTALPTHNEISRMISEHGFFGIVALCILLFSPLITKLQGRKNVYFYSFMIFWFLTVFHSSMRIAAPGFIYGLSLLSLVYKHDKKKKKNTLPRQQTLG
ncbi:O-antigen ligase like membrane protein [Mesonia phycicola]|uniref:O-antigen ligase like membrane protein n=1 Tax=Mesonia phycicola TaxID=579105 RepID=A0A1M6ALJ9_9FLAO|nr:O-antigen ligase like membrane protein [Mesonia phycicola]